MYRATLRQLLWICIIWAVKVEARVEVRPEEKKTSLVNPSYDLCEQIQCLRVEDVLKKTVDLWKNPCENYFAYACNSNYTQPNEHEPFSTDPNKVYKDLKEILERDIVSPLDQGNHALSIEKKIFEKCKTGDVYDHKQKEFYMSTILPRSNANRLLANYDYQTDHGTKNWDDVDLKYALKGFGFAFFEIDVYQEPIQEGSYVNSQCTNGRCILIKPPSYRITDLTSLLGRYFDVNKNDKRPRKYSNLYDFMTKLDTLRLAGTNIALKRISEWQQEYDGHAYLGARIDWLNYFSKLLGIVKQPVRASTFIAVQNPDYFTSLREIIGSTRNVNTIVDFVHLHFVSKSLGLVDSNFREYSILPQIKDLPCTPGLLAGTAYKYADEHFPEENRQLLQTIILKVRDTIIKRIENAKMFVSQRSHPLHTLMFDFVEDYKDAELYTGYPNWLMNETVTYKIYGVSSINTGEQFYAQQTNLIERLLRTKLQSLVTPSMPIFDPTELNRAFESNKIQINTKMNPNSNKNHKEIVIPFGYFNERDYKFFSSQLFDPINYGAAAVEIAFKIYSDFLERITYDKYTPRCIIDQLPYDIYGNREAHLQNTVAYLLALDAAYESWPSKNSYPIQFVDFGAVTDKDLFFLSYAKSLCTIPPKEYNMDRDGQEAYPYRISDYYKISQHINFTLKNFQPFLENHMCQKYNNIYRENQCDPLAFQL